MTTVKERVDTIRERIETACRRAGRPPESVRLMAASKRQPVARIEAAIAAGVDLFGENRVQEIVEKHALLRDVELHLIGHLQRNKARDVASRVACVQSIDAARTAIALAERCAASITVYLEVNTSGEATKHGVAGWDGLARLAEAVLPIEMVRIGGLMTVGPLSDDERVVRAAFQSLRDLGNRLWDAYRIPGPLQLSMGMSGDLEPAIAEGSTMVRVGTALFGERPS